MQLGQRQMQSGPCLVGICVVMVKMAAVLIGSSQGYVGKGRMHEAVQRSSGGSGAAAQDNETKTETEIEKGTDKQPHIIKLTPVSGLPTKSLSSCPHTCRQDCPPQSYPKKHSAVQAHAPVQCTILLLLASQSTAAAAAGVSVQV